MVFLFSLVPLRICEKIFEKALRAASSVSYATLLDLRWKYIAVNVIFHGRFCFCSSLRQNAGFFRKTGNSIS